MGGKILVGPVERLARSGSTTVHPAFRLSQTSAFATPPRKVSASTLAPDQSGSALANRALGKGVIRAPMTATKDLGGAHLR